MSNRAPEDDLSNSSTFRTTSGDSKFAAASNVDRNADGEVVNGPYVDPGSYANADDDLPNVRQNTNDDGSLFVAADRAIAGNLVQPGIAEPVSGTRTTDD